MSTTEGPFDVPDDVDLSWEPVERGSWSERDPLGRALVERSHHRQDGGDVRGGEHRAWLRLPGELRRQAWREREIAAALLPLEDRLSPSDEVVRVGVAVRSIAGRHRLVALVQTAGRLSPPLVMDGLPDSIEVATAIDDRHGVPVAVPVVVEPGSAVEATVDAGLCTGAPSTTTCGRLAVGPGSAARVAHGRSSGGRRTITAVVVDAFGQPGLLTAAHGIAAVGDPVRQGSTGRRVIGSVSRIEPAVDAALIEPTGVYLALAPPVPDRCPAPPVLATAGLPVQVFGATSGHLVGHVDQSYSFPTGELRIGHHLEVLTDLAVAPGDSGCLLLTGHGSEPPIAPSRLGYLSPDWVASMTCAAVGLLSEGTRGDEPSEVRRVAAFVPIVEVLAALDVDLAQPGAALDPAVEWH